MNQQPTPGALRAAERVSSYFFNTKYTFDEELAAIIDSEMPTQVWQPIETAPKESKKSMLVFCSKNRNCYTAYMEAGEWFHFAAGLERLREKPTHWMPLPPHPVSAQPQPPSEPAWRYFRTINGSRIRVNEANGVAKFLKHGRWHALEYISPGDALSMPGCTEITAEEAETQTNDER